MKNKTVMLALLLLIISAPATAQNLISSPHNLSVSTSDLGFKKTAKKTTELDMCHFCHTSHIPKGFLPQSDQMSSGTKYILYNSSTIQAIPGQPSGSSILCLSCHDGTIALGSDISSFAPIGFSNSSFPLDSRINLTTDLSNDHPISFLYDASLASRDNELVHPASLIKEIELENEQLQCTSCHDPHNNIYGKFLTVSNEYSQLCLSCHEKKFWHASGHKNSISKWNGIGINPWPHTPYTNISRNGCENCHMPHGGGSEKWLLKYALEEENCLNCHDGNVASTNIRSELNKPYMHNVYRYQNVHEGEENNVLFSMHVECVDCHNPHASSNVTSVAPIANGNIAAVKGVTADGNPTENIQFEYELCYRCHAESPDKPGSSTPRQVEQNNVMLEFDLSNPSFHPVEGPGKNNDVPSLISPYSESSTIYCTDCHASNGEDSPAGPHGSIYPHILKYRYETDNGTTESFQNYELCYQCHDRNTILNSVYSYSSIVHNKHIVEENTSCNICHDPHGISHSQGSSINNTHLINFDVSAVFPEKETGRLEFVDTGNTTGECYLFCHGVNHNPRGY